MTNETVTNEYIGNFAALQKGIYCGLLYTAPQEEIPKLMDALIELDKSKNGAYKERDILVCLLSKILPAWLERHPDSDTAWEDDWRWIVFIELPCHYSKPRQASWHIHDSELPWFDHLPRRLDANSWDGHTTEEKYQRIMNIADDAPHWVQVMSVPSVRSEILGHLIDKETV